MNKTPADTRVAVVGAGIAGLGAAWALMRSGFDVQVFEKSDYAGGNARRIDVDIEGTLYPLNIGVGGIMHCYHNVLALDHLLGLDLPHVLSWRIFVHAGEGKRWGQSPSRYCQDQNSPYWREVWAEISRFSMEMYHAFVANQVIELGVSIADYVRAHGYSERFLTEVLHPFFSALTEDSSLQVTESMSMMFVPEFLMSKIGCLGTGTDMIQGASKVPTALAKALGPRLRLSTQVEAVTRSEGQVFVDTPEGREVFDQVILATPFNVSSKLLQDQSREEANMLGKYGNRHYHVIVHSDESVLPASRPRDEVFEFYCDLERALPTEDLGRYSGAPSGHVYRSFYDANSKHVPSFIDPKKIIHVSEWDRCQPTTDAVMMMAYLHNIQGRGGVWYCGQSTQIVAFEFSLISGFVAASAVGAEYPLVDYPAAEAIFRKHRKFMLEGAAPNLYMFQNFE